MGADDPLVRGSPQTRDQEKIRQLDESRGSANSGSRKLDIETQRELQQGRRATLRQMIAKASEFILPAMQPQSKPKELHEGARRLTFDMVAAGNETDEERAALRSLIIEARFFVHSMLTGAEPRWLVLCGASGAGKTHLALWLAQWLRTKVRGLYEAHYRKSERIEHAWTYRQEGPLFVKFSKIIDEAREKNYAPFKLACSDWLKIIDDIGAEGLDATGKPHAFVVSQLGKLCDARLKKWTVLTSNYSCSDMAQLFDVRIASRWLRGENAIVDLSCVRDFNIRRREVLSAPLD